MTSKADKNKKSSNLKKGTSLVSITGLIGAWLTAFISWKYQDQELINNLLLGVPFFSICLAESLIWGWLFLKPESVAMLSYRSRLKKTKIIIEGEMKNPLTSDKFKKKLQQKYEKTCDDLINSHRDADLK